MTDPYPSSRSNVPPIPPPTSSPGPSPSTSLPPPLLHPYPYTTMGTPNANANTSSNATIPSIPPFSSLPTSTSPVRTSSPVEKLPSTAQLAAQKDQAPHRHFDQMRPTPVHPSQPQSSSAQPSTLDRVSGTHPFGQSSHPHSMPPLFQHVDIYARVIPQQPLNPLHPAHQQTQALPPPSRMDLPPPQQQPSLAESFRSSQDGSKRDGSLPPPPLQHRPLRPDNPTMRFGPGMQPFGIPPLQPFSDSLNRSSQKNKVPPPAAAPPQPRALPQAPRSPPDRCPQLHPRPQQPMALPPRPILLAGPRGSAVMQTIPKFQHTPLPPRNTNIHQRSIQNPGRSTSPDFEHPVFHRQGEHMPPPFESGRPMLPSQQPPQQVDGGPRPSPERDSPGMCPDGSTSQQQPPPAHPRPHTQAHLQAQVQLRLLQSRIQGQTHSQDESQSHQQAQVRAQSPPLSQVRPQPHPQPRSLSHSHVQSQPSVQPHSQGHSEPQPQPATDLEDHSTSLGRQAGEKSSLRRHNSPPPIRDRRLLESSGNTNDGRTSRTESQLAPPSLSQQQLSSKSGSPMEVSATSLHQRPNLNRSPPPSIDGIARASKPRLISQEVNQSHERPPHDSSLRYEQPMSSQGSPSAVPSDTLRQADTSQQGDRLISNVRGIDGDRSVSTGHRQNQPSERVDQLRAIPPSRSISVTIPTTLRQSPSMVPDEDVHMRDQEQESRPSLSIPVNTTASDEDMNIDTRPHEQIEKGHGDTGSNPPHVTLSSGPMQRQSHGHALASEVARFPKEKGKVGWNAHSMNMQTMATRHIGTMEASSRAEKSQEAHRSLNTSWKGQPASTAKSGSGYMSSNQNRSDASSMLHNNAWVTDAAANNPPPQLQQLSSEFAQQSHSVQHQLTKSHLPSQYSQMRTEPHTVPGPSLPIAQTASSHSQTDDVVRDPGIPSGTASMSRHPKPGANSSRSAATHGERNSKSQNKVSGKGNGKASYEEPKHCLVPATTQVEGHTARLNNQPLIESRENAVATRRDVTPGSQSIGGARQDSPEGSGMTQRRQLKVEDALAYLEKVKTQFAGQLSVYNKFLDIMKEFKAQTIDTAEVIKRVSELFRGHKDLILGFNTFLPPGYKIRVTENPTTGAFNAGFIGPQGQFNELATFRRAAVRAPPPRPVNTKKQPAAPLPKPKEAKRSPPPPAPTTAGGLSNRPPPPAEISIEEPASNTQNASPNVKPGPSPPKLTVVHRPSPKSHVSEDTDRQITPVPSPAPKTTDGHQAKAFEFERAIGFMSAIKDRFNNDPETFTEFHKALGHFRDEQKSIREVFDTVAQLFGPHKDLLSQFREFIPTIATGVLAGLSVGVKQIRRPPAVRSISHSMPPLPRKLNIANGLGKNRHRTRDMKFFDRMKDHLGTRKSHLYTEFIKCLSLLAQGIVSQDELLLLTAEILRDCPDAHNQFLAYLNSMALGEKLLSDEDESSSSSSEKDVPVLDPKRLEFLRSKPMSEIAAESGLDQIVSYRRMPKDFPKYTYEGRSTQERRILNDTWVNVTTGSEDYAFMRKNGNEDNLFRSEDDRYELDMVISSNQSTIMKLEAVISTVSKLSQSEKKRHGLAFGALSPIHFNAIRRIYGVHGDEMVAQVKMNPSTAVRRVLDRLKQKDSEWRKVRNDMNRVWRGVGERNYHRSLDHRSAFFKSIDKKDISLKSLLSDLLDPVGSIAARDAEMTRARNYAIPSGAGSTFDRSGATKAVVAAAEISTNLSPRTLELTFERVSIHKAVFSLIRSAAEDDSSADVKRGVPEFRKMLEAFFDADIEKGIRLENTRKIIIDDTRGGEKKEGTQANDSDYEVLYGDEPAYGMLRLYHLLYERVLTAMQLAQEVVKDRERREKLNRVAALNEERRRAVSECDEKPRMMKYHLDQERSDTGFSLGPENGTALEVFEEFLSLARVFVRSKLDSAKYEEKCRVLLGTGSYCVFTLDKVMQKLMKQIGNVFGGDKVAHDLMKLFFKGRETLKRSDALQGHLGRRGMDQLYSAAASRHLADSRLSGSYLMRFLREYCEVGGPKIELGELRGKTHGKDSGGKVGVERIHAGKGFNDEDGMVGEEKKRMGCVVVIEAIGHAGDDEHSKMQARDREMVDDMLGFCGSYLDCEVHGIRNLSGSGDAIMDSKHGGDGNIKNGGHSHHGWHDSRGKGHGGKSAQKNWGSYWNGGSGSSKGRDGKRNGGGHDSGVERSLRKRHRLQTEFLKFRPNHKEVLRRAENVLLDNGLRWKIDAGGVMRFTAGTGDCMIVGGRKRSWTMQTLNFQELNSCSGRTKKFRKLFNLGDGRPPSCIGGGGSPICGSGEVLTKENGVEKEDVNMTCA